MTNSIVFTLQFRGQPKEVVLVLLNSGDFMWHFYDTTWPEFQALWVTEEEQKDITQQLAQILVGKIKAPFYEDG